MAQVIFYCFLNPHFLWGKRFTNLHLSGSLEHQAALQGAVRARGGNPLMFNGWEVLGCFVFGGGE